MGSCYMYMSGSDEKITCNTCCKIIPVQKVKEHVFECVGKK